MASNDDEPRSLRDQSGIGADWGARVVTVTPVVTNPPLNQSRVNVVITWTGRNMGTTAAAPRRVMLDTTIAPE